MATNATTNPTLADVAKTLDPDGSVAQVIEILNQTNEILEDATFSEGNLPTGHRSTIRTGLPTPTWRKLYGGVQPSKGRTAQVTDNAGMLEAYAEIDKALADLNGNKESFRRLEDAAHIEGINQTMAETLFYGDESIDAEKFTGLSPRYNSLSAANADNIIDAGGTGNDLASIWLMTWGPATAHMITPKGSPSGLQVNDKGQVTIENVDGLGGRMEAYRTHYKWDLGFVLRDWRYVVRIANIEVSDLDTLANTKNLITWMTMASELIPQLGLGRPVFYMNKRIRAKLRLGIVEKIAANLTWETVAGKRVMMFDNIPVRRTDKLLLTESEVQ